MAFTTPPLGGIEMDRLGRRAFLIGTSMALGAGMAGCLEAAHRTEWTKFRGAGNNQASTREHPGHDLKVGWELNVAEHFGVEAEDVVVASPIGETETVYVTSRVDLTDSEDAIATGVVAIDVRDGSTQWSRLYEQPDPMPQALAYPPVIWDEYLLAIDGHTGTVFDRSNGRVAFEFDLPWVPTTLPGGDRALVALGGDLIAMIDLDEEQGVRWSRQEAGASVPPINPLTVLDDRVLVPVGGRMLTIRRGDGEPLSDQIFVESDQPIMLTPPIVDGFYMHYRVRYGDGTEELHALTRSDRSRLWETTLRDGLGESPSMQAYRSGRLYVTDGPNLKSFRVGSGERDFDRSVGFHAPYPTVGGETVYLMGPDEIVAIDRRSGDELTRITLPGESSDLPQEALPRSDALVLARQDRVVGLQPK